MNNLRRWLEFSNHVKQCVSAGYVVMLVSVLFTVANIFLVANKLRILLCSSIFAFLFQRISVVVQRFNSVLLHDGFVDDDQPE